MHYTSAGVTKVVPPSPIKIYTATQTPCNEWYLALDTPTVIFTILHLWSQAQCRRRLSGNLHPAVCCGIQSQAGADLWEIKPLLFATILYPLLFAIILYSLMLATILYLSLLGILLVA